MKVALTRHRKLWLFALLGTVGVIGFVLVNGPLRHIVAPIEWTVTMAVSLLIALSVYGFAKAYRQRESVDNTPS